MQRLYFFCSTLLLLALTWGCSEPVVPGGRLIVRNDVLDKSYNTFVIDSVVTNYGTQPFSRLLKPQEEVEIPYRKIREFRVVRQYADHAKIYHVGCAEDLNTEVRMKLIDIHSNRLSGGCELRKRGRRLSSGVMTWDE